MSMNKMSMRRLKDWAAVEFEYGKFIISWRCYERGEQPDIAVVIPEAKASVKHDAYKKFFGSVDHQKLEELYKYIEGLA